MNVMAVFSLEGKAALVTGTGNRIGYSPVDSLEVLTPYQAQDDYTLFAADEKRLLFCRSSRVILRSFSRRGAYARMRQ